jgi:F-type H+-transporting ATPase subunit b
MQLDWLTFSLEVVNFLVLVWILQHFLYKPIMATIERRKAAIDKTLADASAGQAQAEELEKKYRNRLDAWEQEKEQLRAKVLADVDEERKRRLAEVDQEVDRARERRRAVEAREAEERNRKAEAAALATAMDFVAALLERIASKEVDERLAQVVVEDLKALDGGRRKALAAASQDAGHRIDVWSAFPLDAACRKRITDEIQEVTGVPARAEFSEDGDLVAGLRISIGALVLHANVADELEFFREQAGHAA